VTVQLTVEAVAMSLLSLLDEGLEADWLNA
jgi:hypothetical protein